MYKANDYIICYYMLYTVKKKILFTLRQVYQTQSTKYLNIEICAGKQVEGLKVSRNIYCDA